jgi:hypothetical protein
MNKGDEMINSFEAWWYNEGSGMSPLPGEDAESHVHRMTRLAYLLGAQKAVESLQQTKEQT